MSNKPDFKEALEAILGYELTEDAMQRIQFIQAVASYTRSDLPGKGFITKRNLIANFPPKRCEPADLLDVSGIATTANDGKSVFRLTDFICLDNGLTFAHPVQGEGLFFAQPINVVATPLSSKPFFLTVLHSLAKDEGGNVVDVEIHASSWDASGTPAPNVSFDWRCRVGLLTIIL
jgi:hypothetical protein